MPPLQLFGRSWHISSDDLALPALVGVAFHGAWTALITAEVAAIGLPDDCERSQLASSSVLWLLISFALTTLLQCVVAGISMRGAMLEEHKRAAIPTALYCLFAAYGLEAAALVYATVVNFGVLKDTLYTCHTQEELARTSISELSMNRWFVGTTWAMLTVIGGLLVLLYNLYPDRGLESWEKRVNCLSYILCCRKALTAEAEGDEAAASSAPTVVRLARVFGDLFYPLNFSFTDTVAAITLVGITHRSSAHGHGSSSHNHALIAAAGAGLFAPAKQDAAVAAAALLEAAANAAAAQAAAAAAFGPAAKRGGSLLAPDGPGCMPGESTPQTGVRMSDATRHGLLSAGYEPHTLDRSPRPGAAAGAAAVAADPLLLAPAATACGSHSPSPGLKGLGHSSSTGNLPTALARGSSPAPNDQVSVGRTGSSSAWEVAVRQGSTLAVAPGRGVGSRTSSPSPVQGAGLPNRSYSTHELATVPDRSTSPARFEHRAVSWGASAAGSQQPAVSVSGQGSGMHSQDGGPGLLQDSKAGGNTLHTLAEVSELSLTGAGMIEQVESLLSPLPSTEVSAPLPGEGQAVPPSGAAAAGDAVGHATAPNTSAARPPCSKLDVAAADQQQAPWHPAADTPSAAAAAAAVACVSEEGLEQVGAAVTSDGRPVPLDLLEEALHWHAYANAIYGWPMFLWSHRYRVLRCCRLCCGGFCEGMSPEKHSSGGGMASPAKSLSLADTDKSGSSKKGSHQDLPLTAVVATSSVDTDSASPASTIAGNGDLMTAQQPAAAAEGLHSCHQAAGPVGEGLESAGTAAGGWDLEQGGACCPAVSTAAGGTADAAGSINAATGRADTCGAAVTQDSRGWLPSRGNVWLLQGLADALGVGKEAAIADAAVDHCNKQAHHDSAHGDGVLRSAAGGLWPDNGLCGCVCGGSWGPNHVPKMAPLTASQRLTNEAIMQTANIPAADLLYVNYNNLVEGLLPYSVALDAAKRCVVVAIRGSLSVEDCVTDILYDPAPLDEDWLMQPAAAAAAAAPCQPDGVTHNWLHHDTPLPVAGGPSAAQQALAELPLQQPLQQHQRQQADILLGAEAASTAGGAAEAAAAGGLHSSRSMLGASSGGGSFRSVKASPFASAAAAASAAARDSSSGAAGKDSREHRVVVASQPSTSLARMPSVPAAQAAAAAAAAAAPPLPLGTGGSTSTGQALRRQWSVNMGGLQHQHQQLPGKLSEQPSFVRRLAHSRLQRHQQQQQMSPRPSLLDTALSVFKGGPWRRSRHTASDTGDAHPHRQQHNMDAAAMAAAEEGHLGSCMRDSSNLAAASAATAEVPSEFGSGRRRRSIDAQQPSSGNSTPRNLLKTFSLNLATALGGGRGMGGGQQQQQLRGRRRLAATTSSRLLSPGQEQMLTSCASEMIPSSSSMRRGTADNWLQGQRRRTTAADRALGAARAGHRYAPMTSPATDMSAAAAAASQRSFMLQQQQQHCQQPAQLATMRSTAPASTDSSMSAAAPAVGGVCGGVASELGWASQQDTVVQPGPSGEAADGLEPLPHDSCNSARSRRTTFSQLPRINSGAGAVDEIQQQVELSGLQQQQPQQQPQPQQGSCLSMAASVPAPLQWQQQPYGERRPRPVSDEGSGSMGGSSAGRQPLRQSVSDVARWTRGLRLPLRGRMTAQQQQPQQLLDGGPTDWTLLSGAATMVPSRTAAGPGLSLSHSMQQPVGTPHSPGPASTSHSSSRPTGAVHPVGWSGGSCGTGTADSSVEHQATTYQPGLDAEAHPVADVSPFMLQQVASVGPTAAAASAACGGHQLQQHPGQYESSSWLVQPLLDVNTPEAAGLDATAKEAAEEAAMAQEAEADAVAAAVQAAAAEETPDTGAAGAQWFAHEGILSCARAIRDDLERLGLLDQLLLGPQHASSQQQQDLPAADGQGQQVHVGPAASRVHTGTDDVAAVCSSAVDNAAVQAAAGGSAAAADAGGPASKSAAEEGRWLRSAQLPDCRGWTLVLTGHSLGAGVAALLALHYRARYESVRCWSFAPPGGLMSPAAAASLKDICYSLVSAKDMIPRMSLWTIERLRDEMMICALRCKMPKYKLLLCTALGTKFEEDQVLRPLEDLTAAEIAAFQSYRRAVVEERSLDPLRVRIAREFVPPGEVLWLERCKELQPRLRAPPALTSRTSGSHNNTSTQQSAAASGLHDDSSSEPTPRPADDSTGSTAEAASPAAQLKSRSSPAAGGGYLKSSASSAMLRGGTAALEAAAVAVAGKRVVTRLQPHITDGLGLIVGGMAVSRNMFADHVPDKQLGQLRRLVRDLKRRQAAGQALPAGIAPVTVVQPPQPQGIPARCR